MTGWNETSQYYRTFDKKMCDMVDLMTQMCYHHRVSWKKNVSNHGSPIHMVISLKLGLWNCPDYAIWPNHPDISLCCPLALSHSILPVITKISSVILFIKLEKKYPAKKYLTSSYISNPKFMKLLDNRQAYRLLWQTSAPRPGMRRCTRVYTEQHIL